MRCILSVTAFVLTFFVALPASAQVGGGINVQYGFDREEAQLGGELHLALSSMRGLAFVPNVEVYLSDDPSIVAFNGDFHYAPTVSQNRAFRPYIGAGLALVRASFGGNSNSELGVNLKGGLNFRSERTTPFLQLEYRAGDYDELSLGGGIRVVL